ncbi:MAG TPA: acyltransferase [Edaphobacter sp.]|nr:acyltransferase [Edaphobacter sp.]
MHSTSAALPTKRHYLALDGLRGVAAFLVVIFHMFEVYANDSVFQQKLNHGYLAVDFFFLLSGFVVAYAYDDRWDRMSLWDFFKRRLVRLQPMVAIGTVIGAIFFYLQAGSSFPLIAHTSVAKMLLVMLIGMTMIPVGPSMDIRGWGETYPLDGPAWSLFFEYVANILYALGIRRFNKTVLGILTLLSAALLVHLLVWGPRGDVIGGWSLTGAQLHIGFARLLYPFLAGILLMRLGLHLRIRGSFFVCSALLLTVLCWPRIGTPQTLWANGIYEAVTIIVIFPLIVLIGAGQEPAPGFTSKLCKFLGDISYPLYITHYPLIYTYWAWVRGKHIPAAQGALVGVCLFIAAVSIAYACLKLYDEPLRAWLGRRFLSKKSSTAQSQPTIQ